MEPVVRKPFIRPLFAGILVSILMTGFLAYMVQSQASILRNGTEIKLKTAPVDPTDLFRGDYVVLNYDISIIPMNLVTGSKPPEGNTQKLNVRLAPGPDGFWVVKEASFEKLPAKDGTVVITSLPRVVYYSGQDAINGVTYGIDRYYVPEGQGKSIEQTVSSADLAVIARVSKDGTARIARLDLNGKPLYEEPPY